ncbi:ribosomal L32p protein family-domain-containing protein [Cyathus striatus]|nr:ribosomal L32p protein family-domain-containing protein [Cyathus striatus]
MAALVLSQTRSSLLPVFRAPSLSTLFPRSIPSSSLSLSPSASAQWSLPSLQSLLDLFPPFLLAVPKSKTSHSRKRMRAANKGLNDKQNIVNCPGCGSPKLAHHLCSNCYSFVHRAWKAKQKGEADMPDLS